MRVTRIQLRKIIQEQAAAAQVPEEIRNRIENVSDPVDQEALQDAMEEVWGGARDITDLENMLKDIESNSGSGPAEMMENGDKMKVTKRQLKRIIKEEKSKLLREAEMLPITQGDYDVFVEAIASGYGWIDPDDVERQWEGMFGLKLNPAAVGYLVEVLEEAGLVRDEFALEDPW